MEDLEKHRTDDSKSKDCGSATVEVRGYNNEVTSLLRHG